MPQGFLRAPSPCSLLTSRKCSCWGTGSMSCQKRRGSRSPPLTAFKAGKPTPSSSPWCVSLPVLRAVKKWSGLVTDTWTGGGLLRCDRTRWERWGFWGTAGVWMWRWRGRGSMWRWYAIARRYATTPSWRGCCATSAATVACATPNRAPSAAAASAAWAWAPSCPPLDDYLFFRRRGVADILVVVYKTGGRALYIQWITRGLVNSSVWDECSLSAQGTISCTEKTIFVGLFV